MEDNQHEPQGMDEEFVKRIVRAGGIKIDLQVQCRQDKWRGATLIDEFEVRDAKGGKEQLRVIVMDRIERCLAGTGLFG